MKEKPSHAFVGLLPCGCVELLMSVTMPAVELAKEILKADRAGLTVEFWPRQQAIDAFGNCTHQSEGKS